MLEPLKSRGHVVVGLMQRDGTDAEREAHFTQRLDRLLAPLVLLLGCEFWLFGGWCGGGGGGGWRRRLVAWCWRSA